MALGGVAACGADERTPVVNSDGQSTGAAATGTTSSPGGTSTGPGASSSTADPPDNPVVFDVFTVPDAPGLPCGIGGGEPLSHIWIANSSEHTISKINTETLSEDGRYRSHPGFGDPSRTSVNLNGNVAVANRNGGVAKFWANPTDCVDSNGQPGIQTSNGAGDVRAFGQDECMAWFTELSCNSNRPVAWTTGALSKETCRYEHAKLWTVCDNNILLLNGETGTIEETLSTGSLNSFVYGGAADAFGNFWSLDFGTSSGLVRVDYESLQVTSYPLPGDAGAYGITVDSTGRPFVCSSTVSRFNLDDSTWSTATAFTGGGGCMSDGADRVWHAGGGGGWKGGPASPSLFGFNIDTLELEVTITVPAYSHGVSIDAQDYIWGVTMGSDAFRVDPVTGDVQTFSGLNGAYTYSDMTGLGLAGAGGGGIPQG